MTANQASFFKWFGTFLKDKGLQFTKSGFKHGAGLGSHALNPKTGFWADEQHSAGKPPRWIFHITPQGNGVSASLPNGVHEAGIGSSNTAQGDKAGLVARILPILKVADDNFVRLDEFEVFWI